MVTRDFKKNPITDEELHDCYWYAVVDDLIGGYNISNVDKPASEANVYEGEFEIGCFMERSTAEHIAALHNKNLQDKAWHTYSDNIEAAMAKSIDDYYAGKPVPLPLGVMSLTEDDWFDYADEYEAS